MSALPSAIRELKVPYNNLVPFASKKIVTQNESEKRAHEAAKFTYERGGRENRIKKRSRKCADTFLEGVF
jgi:hypothetical protein